MPMYDFECPECGMKAEDFRSMRNMDTPGDPCPQCGETMVRVFLARAPGTPLRAFDKPIEMYGCAPETPAQLADLRAKCPDLEVNDLLVPVARTPQQKRDVLQACGFEDRSGRGG